MYVILPCTARSPKLSYQFLFSDLICVYIFSSGLCTQYVIGNINKWVFCMLNFIWDFVHKTGDSTLTTHLADCQLKSAQWRTFKIQHCLAVNITRSVLQPRISLQPSQSSSKSLLLSQWPSSIWSFNSEDKDITQGRSCSWDHGSTQPFLSEYQGNLLSHAAYKLRPDSCYPRFCRRYPILRASVCMVRLLVIQSSAR